MKTLKDHRILYLNTQVDESSTSALIEDLLLLDAQSGDEITLLIQSPGGSVYAGLGVVDTIRSLRSKVKTVAVGITASMGVSILLAGDRRVALPSSTIMVHGASGGVRGTIQDFEIAHNEIKRLEALEAKFFKERTGLSDDVIKELHSCDHWLSPEQALELGIITEIEQRTK